jgi:hypothetical protein
VALEYYSFEKVLKELQMDEDELKRLVSEGQIRAFRDEDKMKFRKDDIEGLKKGRQTEPTIILPPGEEHQKPAEDIMVVDDDTDETLLDLEDLGGEETGASDETSVPSLEMNEEEANAETVTEELVFDEDKGGKGNETDEIATQETFIDEDEEVGMTTEPLDLGEEEEEESAKPKTVIASTKRGAAATVRAEAKSGGKSARTAAAAPAMPEVPDTVSPVMLTLTIAVAGLLFYIGLFFIDVIRTSHTGLTGGVGAMLQDTFGKDTDGPSTNWYGDKSKAKGAKGGGKEEEKEEKSEEEPVKEE